MKIQSLDTAAAGAMRAQLADLLLDALASRAVMGFPAGLERRDADAYWGEVQAALADGSRVLLAAAHEGTLLGTVQLELYRRPHGCDGAELQKMMVHSRARRRGIGSVLLRAAEARTRELGRSLLFLDTEAGSGAEHLYHGLGYTRVDEAADADSATAIWYKSLLMPELA
jgi:acetyltransferase